MTWLTVAGKYTLVYCTQSPVVAIIDGAHVLAARRWRRRCRCNLAAQRGLQGRRGDEENSNQSMLATFCPPLPTKRPPLPWSPKTTYTLCRPAEISP